MKKLLFLFLIISGSAFAQTSKDVYEIYYGCYTNGDTIPDEAITNLKDFRLYKNKQKANDASLVAWEYVIYKNKKVVASLPGFGIAPWVYGPDFYGKNMDAWIDCMTYLDEPDEECPQRFLYKQVSQLYFTSTMLNF